MHPLKNPSPVQNATPLSHDGSNHLYHPAKKPVAKGTRSFLRTFSCVGVALSVLLTSAQLPVRQAEALVSPVAKAFVHIVSSALVVDQLTSPQQPQEVQQYATEQCIQTFNSASFLSSTHREAIKKAWCGSAAVGGTLDQIGLLIQTVCSGQGKCLANLQKTMERLMKSLGKKSTVNVQPLCAVLITLVKQSIEAYCKANGYVTDASTSAGSAGKPPKSGGGIKMNSGAKPPSPHFLTGLLLRVQSAIERMWNNCKNPFIRLINPKCAPNSQTVEGTGREIPKERGKIPSTENGRATKNLATQFIQKCTDWFNTFVNGCLVAYKNYRRHYDRSENNAPVTISTLHHYDYLDSKMQTELRQLQTSQKSYVISAANTLVKNRLPLSAQEIEQYLFKIKIILNQIVKIDLLLSNVVRAEHSMLFENKKATNTAKEALKEEIESQTNFMVKITVLSANKNHVIPIPRLFAFEISLYEKDILDIILQEKNVKKQFYKDWVDSGR